MMAGDLGPVARAALASGAAALDAFAIQLMRPVRPMLAESGDSVADALDQLGDAALEYKLDGARVQVHKAGDDVAIFSRTLNDVTASAPEIVALVRALPARELVLDGEVIALKPDGSRIRFRSRCGGSAGSATSRRPRGAAAHAVLLRLPVRRRHRAPRRTARAPREMLHESRPRPRSRA